MTRVADFDTASCPLPHAASAQVLLGHGSGGRLSADLLRDLFLPAFDNEILAALEDQALLPVAAMCGGRLAFTTDSFVVRPLFFPGGDIGKLAVCGTVNDLAVGGARPLFLAAAFILEEGLPMTDLRRIVASMQAACAEAQVQLGGQPEVDVGTFSEAGVAEPTGPNGAGGTAVQTQVWAPLVPVAVLPAAFPDEFEVVGFERRATHVELRKDDPRRR